MLLNLEHFLIKDMRLLSIIIFLCISIFSFSQQKKISTTYDMNQNVTHVYFSLGDVFTIKLHTTEEHQIRIQTSSEGEYASHFVITEKHINSTLNFEGKIAFTFPNHQDKLSAHKLHAIVVNIWVPENLNIVIQTDIGNVSASGKHESLLIETVSGDSYLAQLSGLIKVDTLSGDISLAADKGLVSTTTNSGKIDAVSLPPGESTFELKTNKGNINIRKLSDVKE